MQKNRSKENTGDRNQTNNWNSQPTVYNHSPMLIAAHKNLEDDQVSSIGYLKFSTDDDAPTSNDLNDDDGTNSIVHYFEPSISTWDDSSTRDTLCST